MAESETSPIVDCRGLSRVFRTAQTETAALADVTMSADARSMTAVVGSSGSGKSTLLAVIAALDRPDRGTVSVDGVELTAMSDRQRRRWRRTRLGLVVAVPFDNLTDRHDAGGNLTYAAALAGRSMTDDDVRAVFDELELPDPRRRVRDLSGGEQQRLAVACACAVDPAILVCDEPTASLDASSGERVVGLLRSRASSGVCVVVATHDTRCADAADQVVTLADGRIVE